MTRPRTGCIRVAMLPAIPWLAVDDEITLALQELTARRGRLGATVKEVQPDAFGDHRGHYQLYRSLLAAMTSARQTPEGRQKRIAVWKQDTDESSRAHLRGLEGAPGDFVLWGGQREVFARRGEPSSATGTCSSPLPSTCSPTRTSSGPGRRTTATCDSRST